MADREGIVISDAEVRDVITMLPDFRGWCIQRRSLSIAAGKRVYRRFRREFEARRERLKNALIADRIARSEFVTSAEVDRLMRLFGERRDVSYVTLLPPPQIRKRSHLRKLMFGTRHIRVTTANRNPFVLNMLKWMVATPISSQWMRQH